MSVKKYPVLYQIQQNAHPFSETEGDSHAKLIQAGRRGRAAWRVQKKGPTASIQGKPAIWRVRTLPDSNQHITFSKGHHLDFCAFVFAKKEFSWTISLSVWFMVFVLFHLQKNNSRVGKSACQCESWGQRQTLARPKIAIFPSFVFDQKIIWINWIWGI